jgi:DNA-binding response OmpR family regulator
MTNILIIDDDDDDSEFLRDAISQVNPDTSCAITSNAIDAIHGLKSNSLQRPDLIFLDLNMPRMSGKDCLKELKKDPAISEIPVVIYTTSKSHGEMVDTLGLGAVHFITKPSSFRQLCKYISDIFTNEFIR